LGANLGAVAGATAAAPDHGIVRIEVFPDKLHLAGLNDRRKLIVTGFDATGREHDLTHAARIEGDLPAELSIEGTTVGVKSVAGSDSSAGLPVAPPSPPAILERVAPPVARTTGEYSLAMDISTAFATRGSWSFELLDGRRLGYFVERLSGGESDYPRGQSGWQASDHEASPLLARAVSPVQSGTSHDLAESRVFGHAPLVIRWTAPHAGSVAVAGGVWMARDLDRRVSVSLEISRYGSREPLFRGFTIPERDGDNDGREEGPNSSRPLSFAEAAHFNGLDPKRLTRISLAEGDQIVLTFEGGDFFGVDWDIRYTTRIPTPTPASDGIAKDADPLESAPEIGHGALTVTVGELLKDVSVTWLKGAHAEPISFRHDVLPTMTRLGCNAGACHASPNGKGGFHLSLRGHDASADWETIFYGESGRRLNLATAADSLLLRKPLMDVAHGGGQRLHVDSLDYRTLRDWIAQGSQADVPGSPDCIKLEVYPKERILPEDAPGQQLVAIAHFSDGSVRDVTPRAMFTSSNEESAAVDEGGQVTGLRRGQAAILVQYAAQNATAYLAWTKFVEDEFHWSGPPEQNFIDRLNFEQLRQFRILPAELCTDAVFIRRLYLDLLGRLPRVEETEAFLNDASTDKRPRLIDAALMRPEFANYWALKWADVLRVRNQALTPRGVQAMYEWLVATARDNERFDVFVKTLLTASGGTFQNPAANYYRALETPDDCAETTAELFLGIKIKCAKCHNHPYDRWTQENYHGLAAFFSRVQRRIVEPPKHDGDNEKPAGDAEMMIEVAASGEALHPRTGRPVQAWLPGVGAIDAIEGDPRERFAQWLVHSNNPFFAKVAVNRIWYHLFGRGLVEPIDDFRESNPAVNRPLLDALAADFATHGFDQRHVLRTILNSSTYQLSSSANRWNELDETFLSRSHPRRLSAEQLLDAICDVTEVPERLGGLPEGTLATTMPSPDANHPFLQSFGQPERKSACACERNQEPNFAQALQMVNGTVVQEKLRAVDNRFHRMLREGRSTDEAVQSLYLAALSRCATEEELAIARAHLAAAGDPARGIEDICWVLLNTKEFLFRY